MSIGRCAQWIGQLKQGRVKVQFPKVTNFWKLGSTNPARPAIQHRNAHRRPREVACRCNKEPEQLHARSLQHACTEVCSAKRRRSAHVWLVQRLGLLELPEVEKKLENKRPRNDIRGFNTRLWNSQQYYTDTMLSVPALQTRSCLPQSLKTICLMLNAKVIEIKVVRYCWQCCLLSCRSLKTNRSSECIEIHPLVRKFKKNV